MKKKGIFDGTPKTMIGWPWVMLAILVHGMLFFVPVHSTSVRHEEPEAILVFIEPPQVPVALQEPQPEPIRSVQQPLPKPIPKIPPAKSHRSPSELRHRTDTHLVKPNPSDEPRNEHTDVHEAEVAPIGSHSPPAEAEPSTSHGAEKPMIDTSVGPPPIVESTVGAVGGPQFLYRQIPQYPRLARRLGVEGSVMLRLFIDEFGKLTRAEVVQSAGHGFDEEALRAIRQSTFTPAIQAGKPVSCIALLQIRFQLDN